MTSFQLDQHEIIYTLNDMINIFARLIFRQGLTVYPQLFWSYTDQDCLQVRDPPPSTAMA